MNMPHKKMAPQYCFQLFFMPYKVDHAYNNLLSDCLNPALEQLNFSKLQFV